MKQRKAILYIRVSTDEQAEKGNSLRHQEERLRQHCALNNIEVVGFYKEDHSAKTFERPEFKKLLDFLKRNKNVADTLLFLKWDRFSRNAPEAYAMIAKLQKYNVEPQAMEQPLDLSVPENKIMLAIYLTAPEVENDRRALNIIAGMRRAIKDGRFMGHAPYGYKHSRTEQNKPCIVPGKDAKLVQFAFAEMATGLYHIEEMRRIVAKKGLRIPRTRFWAMLRNPFYIGKVVVPAYKDEPEEVIKGQQEPLVSERLFFEVQEVLEGRKRKDLPTNRCQKEELMLRGFLTCSKCGRRLTGSASRNRHGVKYYYYHCKDECKERYRADTTHETFLSLIENISGNDKALKYLELIITETYRKDGQDKAAELQKVTKEIHTL